MNEKEEQIKDTPALLDELDLRELHHPNSPYTAEQKIAAAMSYVLTGNSVKAEKLCGVPANTIRHWKLRADWWDETVDVCRRQKQDELDGVMTDVIHNAVGQVQQRVEHGEIILVDGDPVIDPDSELGYKTKPVPLKDLTVVLGILYDKRNLIRGDPTSIKGSTDVQTTMAELTKAFTALSRQIKENEPRIIGEGTTVED